MKGRLLILLAAGGAAVCGCFPPQTRPEPRLPRAIFDDIPVMPGMEYVPAQSFVYDAAGRRVCLLKYVGRVEFLAALRFYKEQMQANGWEYANTIGSDQIVVEFDKRNESATLIVWSLGSKRTAVTISIGDTTPSAVAGETKAR